MKVLIVDDSPLICLRLAALLSDVEGVEIAGYTTDSALVISSVTSLKPDVVILDIQLVGASGIDFLRQIRRDHPGIVVVMLTNLADPRYRKTCLEAGAAFFFDKSTQIFELAALFERLAQEPKSGRIAGQKSLAPFDPDPERPPA
ncbi:MAG TPA: response regulator transcription factor [Bacteroidota bacterium]|jgi:DNA-binding NarL/FixJ family response regulator